MFIEKILSPSNVYAERWEQEIKTIQYFISILPIFATEKVKTCIYFARIHFKHWNEVEENISDKHTWHVGFVINPTGKRSSGLLNSLYKTGICFNTVKMWEEENKGQENA